MTINWAAAAAAATATGTPTREVQWNVGPGLVAFMYLTLVLALAIFAYGTWLRVRIWRLGKPEVRWDRPWERCKRVLVMAIGQVSLLRQWLPGIMHALMFFGFLVLFVGTVIVMIHHDLGLPIMRGALYLYFQSLTLDLFGALATIGIGIAAWRRYLRRETRLEQGQVADAAALLVFFLILVTGFVLEGIRIVVTADPWALWSPVGYGVGLALASLLPEPALRALHAGTWGLHVLLWHGALAVLPWTKMFHLLSSPLNIFFANLDADKRSTVPAINFDDEAAIEVLGVKTPFDLTWKQLLNLDACTECGRCQAACPAFAEGKPLSPKRVILDLRDHIRANADTYLRAQAARQRGEQDVFEAILAEMPPLGGGVIQAETLWSCTTCRACEEACPVDIEHVPLILQLRQNLAMEQAEVPEGVAEAVGGMETRQHPWRGAAGDRTAWYEDLDVPVPVLSEVDDPENIEVLYWVGCAAAYDERLQKVARALVRIMHRAGVRFAVLGPEESCTGDPMRRTGNEFHFDLQAKQNVETLNSYGVKTIVTHCPHCLQTLGNDYKAYGGFYQVMHHSQFVWHLIEEGRIQLDGALDETLTFHDPCYLGRYNRIFDPPRQVLDRLGARRVEMPRSRERSFCCGAGGGHFFYEDESGGKINRNRTQEAVATGATTIATGCPFCLAMLEDGVRAVDPDGRVRVRDFVELVDEALAAAETADAASASGHDPGPSSGSGSVS